MIFALLPQGLRADDLLLEALTCEYRYSCRGCVSHLRIRGRFPEGYPVGVVSSVKVDNQRAYSVINVRPSAELQRLRYLLLLWNASEKKQAPPLPLRGLPCCHERLMPLMPQVLPNYEQAGPPLPRSMSQEPTENKRHPK